MTPNKITFRRFSINADKLRQQNTSISKEYEQFTISLMIDQWRYDLQVFRKAAVLITSAILVMSLILYQDALIARKFHWSLYFILTWINISFTGIILWIRVKYHKTRDDLTMAMLRW